MNEPNQASGAASPFLAATVAMNVVHDRAQNLEKIAHYMAQAAERGARLVVFPEAAVQGFIYDVNPHFDPDESQYHWHNAEPIPGPATDQIVEWCAAHELIAVVGLMERVDHPAVPVLHNSAVILDPQGLLGVYRKVHKPTEEEIVYRAGSDWPVFETPVGRLGALICYDQCFPEAARELTLRGAQILAIPNAWARLNQASQDRYDFFGRARAAENRRWVLQSNQTGPSDRGEHVYLGYSRIIAPSGLVVAHVAPGTEGIAFAEITAQTYDPTRAGSAWLLQQRRPETYTAISDFGPYR